MIYLIGGPPRCGKTTLAEAAAKRTSLPYFPLDHVTSLISPYIPERDYATRLPLLAARKEADLGNDVFYSRHSAEEVVNFYLRQAETYWPGVEAFIKYALEDEHDMVLEGWQLIPRLLRAAVAPEHRDRVRVIFLYKTDVEGIVSGLKASTARVDWVLRNTREEATFLAIARMISRFGAYIEGEARRCDFPALNTGADFGQSLRDALELMLA